MDHKIICWECYAVPVPHWVSWIAWDSNGMAYGYTEEPTLGRDQWCPGEDDRVYAFVSPLHLPPPTEDRWERQVYEVA